jgi:hypothetical protein
MNLLKPIGKSDDFTKLTAQGKLDRIEKRLEIAEAIAEEIAKHPRVHGIVNSMTVNSLLNKISSLLNNMTSEIQIDLYDLKTCLHHLEALPKRNEEGELE